MNIDFNAITAIAAVVTAVIALVAVLDEGKSSRFNHGLDVLFRLIDEFEGENLCGKRRIVAKALLGDLQIKNKSEWRYKASEILDHFEMVAILLHRNAIDRELAYIEYAYFFEGYYFLLEDHIETVRRDLNDPILWGDIDWLHKQFIIVAKKFSKKKVYTPPSKEELEKFLNFEVNL